MIYIDRLPGEQSCHSCLFSQDFGHDQGCPTHTAAYADIVTQHRHDEAEHHRARFGKAAA